MIRARTLAALSAKRARGERAGTVPFGFQLAADGRTLETEPAEQRTLARMQRSTFGLQPSAVNDLRTGVPFHEPAAGLDFPHDRRLGVGRDYGDEDHDHEDDDNEDD